MPENIINGFSESEAELEHLPSRQRHLPPENTDNPDTNILSVDLERRQSMRIAQIAPLYESVPPKLYGGTERVVHALTEELVKRGHDVTLFATADSITRARLEPMAESGTRLSRTRDPVSLHLAMLEEVYARESEFDIIHSHADVLGFPFARHARTPSLSTMHGRLDFLEHRRILSRFRNIPLTSISRTQTYPVSDLDLNWVGSVYNGIDPDSFTFQPQPDKPPYLAFLGRLSPEKGPEKAVEIARKAGMTLKIAAKLEPLDEAWARTTVLPLLDDPQVEFLGEVDDQAKNELLGGATALLFPVNWPEPFGMALIEAMACGTPVIAFRGGSTQEVIEDGVTGFLCENVEEAVTALGSVSRLNRQDCRVRVEECFSSASMADGYEATYLRMLSRASDVSALVRAARTTSPTIENGKITELLVSERPA